MGSIKNGKFHYISENTIQHLSLHDCCCSRMYWDDAILIFEMEWMEILASHPDNPFEKAHQSGAGRIVLHDPFIVCGKLIDADNQILIDESIEVKDFEILVFDEITNNGKFELSLLGDSVNEPKSDFIEMKIRYASSDVMFNELGDISWFESNAFINTESPNPM